MGDHLRAIHFNDNRGQKDEHVLPFCGTMSMDDVMCGLLDSGYQGYFTLECDSTLRPGKYWLGNRQASGRDQRLYDPPLDLFSAYEKLLYETARYILNQYNCLEN